MWDSVGDFFHMGGYGLYVWGSYGVTALAIVIELLLVKQRKRTIWSRLGRMARMRIEVNHEAQT